MKRIRLEDLAEIVPTDTKWEIHPEASMYYKCANGKYAECFTDQIPIAFNKCFVVQLYPVKSTLIVYLEDDDTKTAVKEKSVLSHSAHYRDYSDAVSENKRRFQHNPSLRPAITR